MAKMRNTVVNGGMTGRDKGINRVFAYKNGKSYSQVKAFTKPSNPQSAAQQAIRSRFTLQAVGWSGLTDDQRKAWNEAVIGIDFTDQFGKTSVSGKAYNAGANIALSAAGLPTIINPGARDFKAKIGSVSVTCEAGALRWNVEFSGTSAVDAVQLAISGQKSAGTSKVGKLTIMSNSVCAADVNGNITAEYVAKYGALIAGQKIFFSTSLISQGGNKVVVQESSLTVAL